MYKPTRLSLFYLTFLSLCDAINASEVSHDNVKFNKADNKLITVSLGTYLADKAISDIGKAINNLTEYLQLLISFKPLALPFLTPISIQNKVESILRHHNQQSR